MNCAKAREHLELLALDGLSAARRKAVEDHVAGCGSCRAAAAECRAIVDRVKRAPAPAPNERFEQSLRVAVRREISLQRRRRLSARAVVGVAAAALLVAAVAVWGWNRATGPSQVIVRTRLTKASDPAPGPEDPLAHAQVVVPVGGVGHQRWQLPDKHLGHLAADSVRVFTLISSRRGRVSLVALDATDGTPLWEYSQRAAGHFAGPARPAVLPGNRVCWTNAETVHMLDATTGKVIWRQALGEKGRLSVAAAEDGAVYVAGPGALHCLDAVGGQARWRRPWRAPMRTSSRLLLAVSDGAAFVVQRRRTGTSQVIRIDLSTRREAWRRPVPWVFDALATSDGLYLRTGGIMAFDRDTGQAAWSRRAEGCGPMTMADGLLHVVVSGSTGRLVALDPRTGREVWGYPSVRSCGAFVRVEGAGYLRTDDGAIHAVAFGRRQSAPSPTRY